jgi:hypothetical protein
MSNEEIRAECLLLAKTSLLTWPLAKEIAKGQDSKEARAKSITSCYNVDLTHSL